MWIWSSCCGSICNTSSPQNLKPLTPFPFQELEIQVCDSHMTGRVEVGRVRLSLASLPPYGTWLPLQVRGVGGGVKVKLGVGGMERTMQQGAL